MPLRTLFEETSRLVADDPKLAARLDSTFYSSLGSGWSDALDESFDREVAVGSVAFYPAEGVPKVDNPTPLTVFDVRFRSDLAAVPSLDVGHLRECGGLFAAAVPARSLA